MGETFTMGIVGGNRPSTYSMSPYLWNEWCAATGFPGRFSAYDVDAVDDLYEFLERVWLDPHFVDLTITNPYKAIAYDWFSKRVSTDEIDKRETEVLFTPTCRRLRAMNHLIRGPDGARVVDNTDGEGLLRELPGDLLTSGTRVLLVGAGGAARSIADALLANGSILTVANIADADAVSMVERLSTDYPHSDISCIPWAELDRGRSRGEVVILAITEGNPFAWHNTDATWRGTAVIDIRYGETALGFQSARAAGIAAYDGRYMLFGQFALAVERLAVMHGVSRSRNRDSLERLRSEFFSK